MSFFNLLNIKLGVLPVSSIRINCFSDISILSCEQWSSNRQCHPVLAACLSAHLTKPDVELVCGRLGWWEGGVGVSFFFSNTAQCQSVTFTIGDLGRHGKWRWKLTYRLSKERQNYWPDTPTNFLYLTVLVTRNQTWLLLLGLSIKKIYIYIPCIALHLVNSSVI